MVVVLRNTVDAVDANTSTVITFVAGYTKTTCPTRDLAANCAIIEYDFWSTGMSKIASTFPTLGRTNSTGGME